MPAEDLTESLVELSTLEWFADLGYATGSCP